MRRRKKRRTNRRNRPAGRVIRNEVLEQGAHWATIFGFLIAIIGIIVPIVLWYLSQNTNQYKSDISTLQTLNVLEAENLNLAMTALALQSLSPNESIARVTANPNEIDNLRATIQAVSLKIQIQETLLANSVTQPLTSTKMIQNTPTNILPAHTPNPPTQALPPLPTNIPASINWLPQVTCQYSQIRGQNDGSVTLSVTGSISSTSDSGQSYSIASVPAGQDSCGVGNWCGPIGDIPKNFHGTIKGSAIASYLGFIVSVESIDKRLDCGN